jgi:uncharacterized protein
MTPARRGMGSVMALPPPDPQSTALVTGASAGIGRALAAGLAAKGHGVTLVARRRERLEELATQLAGDHGVRAEVVSADLSDAGDRARLAEEVAARSMAVEILVNNAGFGIYGPFPASLERELGQVNLLVAAVVDLNARYLPAMLERGRGAIINISSTAGLQPLPGNGTYAASKAFVLYHSEALYAETRGAGVSVTAVCPGPVQTEFQETSDARFQSALPKFTWCDPERVAEDALAAAERGKRTVVPGGPAVRLFFGPNRIAPPGLALAIAKRVMAQDLKRERD